VSSLISSSALFALAQVLMINIVLSGDNAIVIGMVASRASRADRKRVIAAGMAAAVVLRIGLALVAVDLLNVLGLTLAGGIVLMWVAWHLYLDIREKHRQRAAHAARAAAGDPPLEMAHSPPLPFGRAIFEIAIADISMSVDNVLAVAGAANQNVPVLVIGLVLSVALMGAAAHAIVHLLQRHHWLSYIGVALIVYVGAKMIWQGSGDVPALLRTL
jgi:YjbE family integral membrane protein